VPRVAADREVDFLLHGGDPGEECSLPRAKING
jgi:hypothetical protein